MNFLKLHVMLKLIKYGVQPTKEMLDDAIEFVRKYRHIKEKTE